MARFLITDDSNFMRRSLRKLLTDLGHEIVGEAENGKLALERYKELRPDIVTMDVVMREMSGLEALRGIMTYDRAARVIMVTSMGQAPVVREAISLGAKGFILKPYEKELVISVISRIL